MFNDPWVRVPGTSLTNWPDEYIHSSVDDLWQIDPTQLKRNAFVVAATAWWLANADAQDVPFLASFVAARGAERMARDLATAQAWIRDGKGSEDDRRRAARDLLAVSAAIEESAVASARSVGPAPESSVAASVAAVRAAGADLAQRLDARPAAEDAVLARLARKTPRFAVTTLDAWMALEERVKDERETVTRAAREKKEKDDAARRPAKPGAKPVPRGRASRRGSEALAAHGHRGPHLDRRKDRRRRDRAPRLRRGAVGRLVVLRGDDAGARREVSRRAGQGRPDRLVSGRRPRTGTGLDADTAAVKASLAWR